MLWTKIPVIGWAWGVAKNASMAVPFWCCWTWWGNRGEVLSVSAMVLGTDTIP